MTDEGFQGQPIDAVEMLASMASMAAVVAAFFRGLLEQGFDEAKALRLTCAYIHGMAGGKIES